MGRVLSLVEDFYKPFGDDKVRSVSLRFVNVRPKAFTASTRPDAFQKANLDPLMALRLFLDAAATSLEPTGGIRSSCEWAMLHATRNTR